MAPITVTFRCGHKTEVPRDAQAAPRCPQCGDTVVARVLNAVPRFRASGCDVRGAHVEKAS